MVGEINNDQVQTLMKWAYLQGALDEKDGKEIDAESFMIHAAIGMEEEIQRRLKERE